MLKYEMPLLSSLLSYPESRCHSIQSRSHVHGLMLGALGPTGAYKATRIRRASNNQTGYRGSPPTRPNSNIIASRCTISIQHTHPWISSLRSPLPLTLSLPLPWSRMTPPLIALSHRRFFYPVMRYFSFNDDLIIIGMLHLPQHSRF
jgi:hypothetical protein